ncbi:MAG: hypothetical protein U0T79_01930 [Ferruginibacter sp.]
MKKIMLLAMVCTLATGAFANTNKPKKLKKNKQQCSQQTNCKPANCQPSNCCPMPGCAKA